jgi:hypothetical protein
MPNEKPKRSFIAEALQSDEQVELLSEILASLTRMSKEIGSGPVIEMLSASIAIIGNAEGRAGYDELRKELVRYLQTLDDGSIEQPSKTPAFQASPEMSNSQVESFVQFLAATAQKNSGGATGE